MRLPVLPASTVLSLAAGMLTVAAVASAWVPLARDARRAEERQLRVEIATVAALGAAALEGGARGPGALDALVAASRAEHAWVFGPGAPLWAEAPPRAVAERCPPAEAPDTPAVVEFELDGADARLACTAVELGARPAAIAVVAAPGRRPWSERVDLRATALMLLVGAIAGLVVVGGTRWLLAPVREAAEAARRIAEGERGVKVRTRGPDEIARLASAVNALASSIEAREDEIRGRLEVVTQLSSMVAHEVRNPLQSLSLLCTLARTERDPETRDRLLGDIETEIHVLEGVVQRFLRNSGPLQITRARVDLVEVVRRATAIAEPEARARRVGIIVQAPGRLELAVDGSLVRRAMENLVLNAIEFAAQQPPGHVTVSVLPRPGTVLLVVDDDGPGVPPEDRERIFQPYFSSKSGGTGLGLALVKQVFEAHGGGIRCEDSPLGGARFAAWLPRGRREEET